MEVNFSKLHLAPYPLSKDFTSLDTFEGVMCSTQEECKFLNTTCDVTKGRCRMQTTQQARDNYFECFYEKMPPMVEVNSMLCFLYSFHSKFPFRTTFAHRF